MNLATIALRFGAVVGVYLVGYAVYTYLRPPQVTPLSDSGLANILRVDSIRGDTHNG